MPRAAKIPVYLEIGQRKVFAGALDWPGWCRSGRDEDSALAALLDYGPRYATVVRPKRLGFVSPKDAAGLTVVERLKGDATTDFGAPSKSTAGDADPLDVAEARRLRRVFEASWAAFDAAAKAAGSKRLRKGPRGGGRDLPKIVDHVREADVGYLSMIGVKVGASGSRNRPSQMDAVRSAILDAIDAAPGSGPVRPGPRGGKRWSHRFFVRRSVWHVLDHAWEIEDRSS
jgi:hypothetical protein